MKYENMKTNKFKKVLNTVKVMKVNMKKIKTLVAGIASFFIASTALSETPLDGCPYAISQTNLETYMQCLGQGDGLAMDKMVLAEKVSIFDGSETVTMISAPILREVSEVQVRIKGDPQVYWTVFSGIKQN